MKEILKTINSILHSWDPIGYTPADEYNDLAIKIYKKLSDGKSSEQLVDFIDDYLLNVLELKDISRSTISENAVRIMNEFKRISESQ